MNELEEVNKGDLFVFVAGHEGLKNITERIKKEGNIIGSLQTTISPSGKKISIIDNDSEPEYMIEEDWRESLGTSKHKQKYSKNANRY